MLLIGEVLLTKNTEVYGRFCNKLQVVVQSD